MVKRRSPPGAARRRHKLRERRRVGDHIVLHRVGVPPPQPWRILPQPHPDAVRRRFARENLVEASDVRHRLLRIDVGHRLSDASNKAAGVDRAPGPQRIPNTPK
jgi:hypothetical protein